MACRLPLKRATRRAPAAVLALIDEEVRREISVLTARQSNALSRAAILEALAAVLIGAALPDSNSFLAGSVVFGGVGAVWAFVAIVLWKSKAGTITDDDVEVWLHASESDLRYRLIQWRMDELEWQRRDLRLKNGFLLASMSSLGASLALLLVGRLLA